MCIDRKRQKWTKRQNLKLLKAQNQINWCVPQRSHKVDVYTGITLESVSNLLSYLESHKCLEVKCLKLHVSYPIFISKVMFCWRMTSPLREVLPTSVRQCLFLVLRSFHLCHFSFPPFFMCLCLCHWVLSFAQTSWFSSNSTFANSN